MQNIHNKREFTTFDTFSVLALVSSVFVIVASLVSNAKPNQKDELAQVKSRQLAIQIATGGYRSTLSDQSERSLASSKLDLKPEGRIGLDPWGVPYFYKLIENGEGIKTVTVLSSGPNGRMESLEEFENNEKNKSGSIRLSGDDLASVITR